MAQNKLVRNKISSSTQEYLDIAEIKEDTVIMRDGTLRSVILVSSINFALKSEDEQNAIIAAYVGFLNNIDFPLQIVIQSRESNIENYLNSLRQKEKEQTNELLKMQIGEYLQYINELIAMSKIMNKRFYVVVPYNPMTDNQKNFFSRVLDVFKHRKKELSKRIDNIMSGLSSIGLNAVPLDTQGLIELYFNSYNPITSANQNLTDVNQLRVEKD